MNCASFSRLAVLALVWLAASGNQARAETAVSVVQTTHIASPPAPSSAESRIVDATGEVMRLAQAASAVFASDSRGDRPEKSEQFAEPSALLIGLAGLVVIVFVTARRRSDDN